MTAGRGLPPWHTAVVAVLFVPAVLAFEPLFGRGVGLRAAGAGVVVGLALALVGTLARWHPLTLVAATVVAYLAGAGAAALPDTAIAGIVPTWQTIQLAVVGAVDSWKDLLTLTPPAGSYTGPAIMPWLAGLACAASAGALVLRRGAYALATLPIAALGVIGIAWGVGGAAPPAWPAVAWAVGVLAWWAWCAHARRVVSGETVVVGRRALGADAISGTGTGAGTGTGTGTPAAIRPLRQLLVGTATLALAIAVAVAVTPSLPMFHRTVLRDVVVPPLDVQQYPTPLAAFRYYETDLKTQGLVTVTGLPKGARVRLAVMDTYDGITFGMSSPALAADGTGGYVRVGQELRTAPWDGEGEQVDLTFETDSLVGPWVPAAGIPDRLTFTSPDAARLQDGLYLNRWANTLLTTATMVQPAAYTVHTVVPPVWAPAQVRGLGTPPPQGVPDSGVPQDVSDLAKKVTAGQQGQWDRANAIATYLSKKGKFSNANTEYSRPGHRADRLSRLLLDEENMIGDDEQYATLAALMMRSLGLPARVVMGLYPDSNSGDGAPITLRGYDMHVWVEVEFDQVGWVVFDPTPPRDQTPKTETQRPQSVPHNQVLPPPDPPKDPVQLPPRVTDRPDPSQADDIRPIPWQAIGLGAVGLMLLLGPIALVLLLKARRRDRRRRDVPAAAICGAWDEIVDYAVDAGVRVPANLTRRESANLLAGVMWPGAAESEPLDTWEPSSAQAPPVAVLARAVDTAVFGPSVPSPAQVDETWAAADCLRQDHEKACGRLVRARHAVSLRSFRRTMNPIPRANTRNGVILREIAESTVPVTSMDAATAMTGTGADIQRSQKEPTR